MIRICLPLALAVLFAPCPALAQETSSDTPQTAADCTAPGGPTDQLVCNTPALLALDRQMTALLAKMGTIDAKLVEAQADWFERRSKCATDKHAAACTETAYRERIAVLQALTAPPAQGPAPFPCRFETAGILQIDKGDTLTLVRDGTGRLQGVAMPREKGSRWYPYLRIVDSPEQLRFVVGNNTSYCERP